MLDLKILVLLETKKENFAANSYSWFIVVKVVYFNLFIPISLPSKVFEKISFYFLEHTLTVDLLCFLATVRDASSFTVSSLVMAADVISEPFIGS